VKSIAAALVVLATGSLSAQGDARISTVVGTYCASCHNGRLRSPSGLLLEAFDAGQVADHPVLWARAYRQLQAGAMPPAGSPRPERDAVDAALLAIEQTLGTGMKPPAAARDDAIATRLARLLWNGPPDDLLWKEARAHRLTGAALERQVRRMLADDRAQAFVARFFFPWLQLDALATADPDTKHYGVPGVTGPAFRRVSLTSSERAGLLGQGSVLMVTSRHQHGVDAGYTTPATRAKWVRLHYFGAPLPNGFPGAQPVKPELPITPQTRTLPVEPCVNCHRNFFPIGYALENFDPIGRWRTQDQLGPVDASGAFVDGTPTNGVVELRRVLLQYPEAFRTTLVEGLFTYVSTGATPGVPGTPDTLVQARSILRATPSRWSALIAAVVRAPAL
jgi:hypothetical protein